MRYTSSISGTKVLAFLFAQYLLILIQPANSLFAQSSVNIGSQTWMVKNLNEGKFANGEIILNAKSDEEWLKAGANQQPAWCYFENKPENGPRYGRLYNWYAVADPRGLCPSGWHVPDEEEWTLLIEELGVYESSVALKAEMRPVEEVRFVEAGGGYESLVCPACSDWSQEYRRKIPCHKCKDRRRIQGKYIPVTKKKVVETVNAGWDGSNSSGFSALLGASRSDEFSLFGFYAGWWTSTESSPEEAGSVLITNEHSMPLRQMDEKSMGLNVRCVKDEP